MENENKKIWKTTCKKNTELLNETRFCDSIKQNMYCLVNRIQRIRDECTGYINCSSFITDSILELMGEFLEDHEA